jgi:hypothetical protein
MRIFGKDGKEYDSYKAALDADKAYDEMVAEEEARKEQLKAERATRAKEVEDAFKASAAAIKNYYELLDAFVNDYGNYHCTISDSDINDTGWKLVDSLINTFFKF